MKIIMACLGVQRIHLISFGSVADQIEDLRHGLPTAAVQWKRPFDKVGYAVERN